MAVKATEQAKRHIGTPRNTDKNDSTRADRRALLPLVNSFYGLLREWQAEFSPRSYSKPAYARVESGLYSKSKQRVLNHGQ